MATVTLTAVLSTSYVPVLPRAAAALPAVQRPAISPLNRLHMRSDPSEEVSKKPSSIQQSEEVGVRIFAVLLVAIVWLFTLPPEIRRTKICTTDDPKRLEKVYAFAGECESVDALVGKVRDHYALCTTPGSGVPCAKLDLTIDPKTKEFNRAVLRAKGWGS